MLTFELLVLTVYIVIICSVLKGLNRTDYPKNNKIQSFSVIVAARNEEKGISNLLDSLVKQDYPADSYEVIIVNDRSVDKTENIIKGFVDNYSNFSYITIDETKEGLGPKKYALLSGIKQAEHGLICITDADCIVPETWLSSIVTYFTDETGLVAGFAPLVPKDSAVSGAVAFDSVISAFIAAGSIGNGSPVTCTARNLAFRKKAFEEAGGYHTHKKSLAGDDDLLLQAVHTKTDWKAAFAKEEDVTVRSHAPESIGEVLRQKTRHVSASKYYRKKYQLGFGLLHLSNLLLWAAPVLTLFTDLSLSSAVNIFLLKFIFDYVVCKKIFKYFGRDFTFDCFIIWELYYLISNIFIGPLGLVKKFTWKG